MGLSLLIPVLMLLCCLPWGIEWVLKTKFSLAEGIPLAMFLFPLLVCLSYWVYEKLLGLVAELFQSQELSLLKTVTSIVEK